MSTLASWNGTRRGRSFLGLSVFSKSSASEDSLSVMAIRGRLNPTFCFCSFCMEHYFEYLSLEEEIFWFRT
eukprot:UN18592